MKESESTKFRRYVFDCVRLDGGETGWTRIRQDELAELHRMAADGLIDLAPEPTAPYVVRCRLPVTP